VVVTHSFADGTTRREIILNDSILLDTTTDGLFLRKQLHDRLLSEIRHSTSSHRTPNYLLFGSQGSGKTELLNRLVASLKSLGVKCVYANCWRYYTRMAVYSLIAREIGEAIPRRGLATDEVFERLSQVTAHSGERVVVVLDEIDGLLFNHQERLLFDLSEASDGKHQFSFIGVCNDVRGFSELDERLRLSLHLDEIEVKPFSPAELEQIITVKATNALRQGSFEKDVISACVARTLELNGNVKLGLQLLWRAALLAEIKGREKITLEDVRAVEAACPHHSQAKTNLLQTLRAELSGEERLILSILAKGSTTSTRLYAEFRRRTDLTKRQIRNYLLRLQARNLVTVIEQPDSPYFYKSRVFRLNL